MCANICYTHLGGQVSLAMTEMKHSLCCHMWVKVFIGQIARFPAFLMCLCRKKLASFSDAPIKFLDVQENTLLKYVQHVRNTNYSV